jgi:hypothetical protein
MGKGDILQGTERSITFDRGNIGQRRVDTALFNLLNKILAIKRTVQHVQHMYIKDKLTNVSVCP